jgi:oligoendopeptidase F
MPELTVPPRSAIAPEHTWNAPSVFESVAAWEAELKSVAERLPTVAKFKDHLADGPSTLADMLEALEALFHSMEKAYVYASMAQAVDTTDQAAAARFGQSQAVFGQVLAVVAFLDPELIAIGQDQLNQWIKAEPRLAIYQHYVDDLFRRQAHVRSAEVEELLGLLSEPFAGTHQTASLLTDSDMKFAPAHSSTGEAQEVTQGSIEKLLASTDRETRRTAWESHADTY